MLKKNLSFCSGSEFFNCIIVVGCFFLVEHFDREFTSFSCSFWQGKSQHFLSENSVKQRNRTRLRSVANSSVIIEKKKP